MPVQCWKQQQRRCCEDESTRFGHDYGSEEKQAAGAPRPMTIITSNESIWMGEMSLYLLAG